MSDDEDTSHTFGTQLRAKREHAGLSIRRAAAGAEISEGRWRQLERGYQKTAGHEIPVNPRASTVAAMARAIQWDVSEALTVAGFDPHELDQSQPTESDVVDLTNWHMLTGPQKSTVRQLVQVMANPAATVDTGAATVHALGEQRQPGSSEATVHELGDAGQRQY